MLVNLVESIVEQFTSAAHAESVAGPRSASTAGALGAKYETGPESASTAGSVRRMRTFLCLSVQQVLRLVVIAET